MANSYGNQVVNYINSISVSFSLLVATPEVLAITENTQLRMLAACEGFTWLKNLIFLQ